MSREQNQASKKILFTKRGRNVTPNQNRFFRTDSGSRLAQPFAASNVTDKSAWFFCDNNAQIVDESGRNMITYQAATQEYNAQKDPLLVVIYKLLLMNRINNLEMICLPMVTVLNACIYAVLNSTLNASDSVSRMGIVTDATFSYELFNPPVVIQNPDKFILSSLSNETGMTQQQIDAIHHQISVATGVSILFNFLRDKLPFLDLPNFDFLDHDFLTMFFDEMKRTVLEKLRELQDANLVKLAAIVKVLVIVGIVLLSIIMTLVLGTCVIAMGVGLTIAFEKNELSHSVQVSHNELNTNTDAHTIVQMDLSNAHSEVDADTTRSVEMTTIMMPPSAQ